MFALEYMLVWFMFVCLHICVCVCTYVNVRSYVQECLLKVFLYIHACVLFVWLWCFLCYECDFISVFMHVRTYVFVTVDVYAYVSALYVHACFCICNFVYTWCVHVFVYKCQ